MDRLDVIEARIEFLMLGLFALVFTSLFISQSNLFRGIICFCVASLSFGVYTGSIMREKKDKEQNKYRKNKWWGAFKIPPMPMKEDYVEEVRK